MRFLPCSDPGLLSWRAGIAAAAALVSLAQIEGCTCSHQVMEPHYVRCIKPNSLNKPMLFEGGNVLQQLRCGGRCGRGCRGGGSSSLQVCSSCVHQLHSSAFQFPASTPHPACGG